jgi:hypothetical protein
VKSVLKVLYIVLALVAAQPVFAQRGTMAVPSQAEMEKYPILKSGEMTVAKMAKLELRPVVLLDTMTVFNWYGRDGRFVYETLRKGTLVYVDKDGVVRYKADCTNRIVKTSDCPECREQIAMLHVVDSALKANKTSSTASTTSKAKSDGWFSRTIGGIWDFFSDLFMGLLRFLAILGVISACIGLLILFGWLLTEFGRGIRNAWRARNSPPVVLTPGTTPATQTPAVAASVPASATTPVATTVPTGAATPASASAPPAPAIIRPVRHEVHLFYPDGTQIVL